MCHLTAGAKVGTDGLVELPGRVLDMSIGQIKPLDVKLSPAEMAAYQRLYSMVEQQEVDGVVHLRLARGDFARRGILSGWMYSKLVKRGILKLIVSQDEKGRTRKLWELLPVKVAQGENLVASRVSSQPKGIDDILGDLKEQREEHFQKLKKIEETIKKLEDAKKAIRDLKK